jgi:DNA repair protein RecO
LRLTPALVLRAAPHRETDRLCVLYTEEFGKIRIRFIGVERPSGKLKGLSETMVLGEFRMYLREGAEFATGAGGAIHSAFPGIRGNLSATLRGLEMLELLDRLTPFWKPNPEKFSLASSFLLALDAGPSGGPWLVPALTLRLLEEAGFGLAERKVSAQHEGLWQVLHTATAHEIATLPDESKARSRLETFLRTAVERVSEKPLHAAAMRDEIALETVEL